MKNIRIDGLWTLTFSLLLVGLKASGNTDLSWFWVLLPALLRGLYIAALYVTYWLASRKALKLQEHLVGKSGDLPFPAQNYL